MQTHDNVAAQATSSPAVAQGDTVSTNETVNTSPLPTEMNDSNNPQSKIITRDSGGSLDCASSRETSAGRTAAGPRAHIDPGTRAPIDPGAESVTAEPRLPIDPSAKQPRLPIAPGTRSVAGYRTPAHDINNSHNGGWLRRGRCDADAN